ncbi:hypothetical protein EDB85DRAFT_127341 [Lactarius pseudohatsudake]|nr:hypothetical protein EDB85DRAFT_127341 [Lactarius pseudohatsudake]
MDSSGSHLLLPHISAVPPTNSRRYIDQRVPTQPPCCISRLSISGTPDHVLGSISHHQQQQQYPQQQMIGHSTLAARISHHLRATSRACSFSPLPVPSQSLPPQPTQVEVEVLAPKPMPSPKLVSEGARRRPIFTEPRVETRTRSLSVVKLEELTARTAAEKEAKAAVDKTLPAPPVPFGKPLGQAPKC